MSGQAVILGFILVCLFVGQSKIEEKKRDHSLARGNIANGTIFILGVKGFSVIRPSPDEPPPFAPSCPSLLPNVFLIPLFRFLLF